MYMNIGYAPAEWMMMYSTIATSAVALAGLMSLFFIGLLVLIPGQGPAPLGWELLGVGAIIAVFSIRLQGETIRRLSAERRSKWAFRLVAFNSATIALIVAGISLVVGAGGGLYWLLPTVVIYFTWSILNAWKLVVQPLSQ